MKTREEAIESFYVSEAGCIGETIVHEIYNEIDYRICKNCVKWGYEFANLCPMTNLEALYETDSCSKFMDKEKVKD